MGKNDRTAHAGAPDPNDENVCRKNKDPVDHKGGRPSEKKAVYSERSANAKKLQRRN